MSNTSEQINEVVTALSKAQAEMNNAPFNQTNPAFKSKYADLASIRDATIPHLAKNGLSLFQMTTLNGEGMLLVTRLAHSSGQWLEAQYPLPIADRPHIMGSALTYARRYSWAAICGIAAEEDDDGNDAQEGAKNGQPVKRTRAEISEAANRKRQSFRDVGKDLLQIDNLTALDRYEREVLTPDFMASLGQIQWSVEQKVGERRRELEDWQKAAEREPYEDENLEELSPDQRLAWDECRNWLGGATTAADLVKRATKNEGYIAALPRLTEKQREALRGYYKQRLGEFGREAAAQ